MRGSLIRAAAGLAAALSLALGAGEVLSAPAKWKHGIVIPKADTAFIFMAREKGFYAEEGVDPEFIPISGMNLMKALIAGTVDMIDQTPGVVFPAIESGARLKIVGATLISLPHVLYVRKEIGSVRELVGRVMGVSTMGSLPHVLVATLLEKYGIDEKQVRWANAGEEPDRVRAVIAGKVDAAASSVEFTPFLKDTQAKVLLNFSDEVPQYVRQTHITTDRVITERADVLTRVLTAHVRGVRHALARREETLELMGKITKKPAGEFGWLYDFFVKNRLVQPNLYVSPEALQWMQQLNVKIKKQSAVLPSERVGTWEFQKKVVARLGEAPW